MRAIYSVSFEFSDGVAADDVLDVACRWFARGKAPAEIRGDWTPGRRQYPLPEEGHTLEVEVFASDEGRLWQGTWRHPHRDDRDLHVVSDVEVGDDAGRVTLSLVIRVMWARAKVAPPKYNMAGPRLPRTIVERFDVRDAGRRLRARSQILDAAAVDALIDDLLLAPERTRPVVFVSDDPRRMGPNVDPGKLAAQLAGLAHVYHSVYGRPARELNRRLDRLGCGDGGIRVWWPGFGLDDEPFRHPLLTGNALRTWHGPTPIEVLFRRISTAAAMNAVPPAHGVMRRAGRRAQFGRSTDAEARELLALALDENEQLVADMAAMRDEYELLELERDEFSEKAASLGQELAEAHRVYGEALSAQGVDVPVEFGETADADEPEIRTVRDAVDAAVDQCPHLEFADRAFESADDSPFQRPEMVIEALLKLERLAALWARPEGIGGKDLGQMAAELGLDWKADVSQRAKTDREYSFVRGGERLVMGPHVRLGSGSGAGRIARIYLCKLEPEDPTERKLIVAHVGRKLRDSTT